jgi:hypothetical protein
LHDIYTFIVFDWGWTQSVDAVVLPPPLWLWLIVEDVFGGNDDSEASLTQWETNRNTYLFGGQRGGEREREGERGMKGVGGRNGVGGRDVRDW